MIGTVITVHVPIAKWVYKHMCSMCKEIWVGLRVRYKKNVCTRNWNSSDCVHVPTAKCVQFVRRSGLRLWFAIDIYGWIASVGCIGIGSIDCVSCVGSIGYVGSVCSIGCIGSVGCITECNILGENRKVITTAKKVNNFYHYMCCQK